jgi:hypothetical protein
MACLLVFELKFIQDAHQVVGVIFVKKSRLIAQAA